MTIQTEDVINAIEEAGFEHKDISQRLFRIPVAPREYVFIEIIAYRDIALNSQIIGKLPELKTRLAELKHEHEKPRKRQEQKRDDSDD